MLKVNSISDIASAQIALVKLRVGDSEFAEMYDRMHALLPLADIIEKYIAHAKVMIREAFSVHNRETVRSYIELLRNYAMPLLAFERERRISHPTDADGAHLSPSYGLELCLSQS